MSILLGPILFIMDAAPANVWSGLALTIILLPAMALFAVRPKAWTAALSLVALIVWVILGVIGDGIGA